MEAQRKPPTKQNKLLLVWLWVQWVVQSWIMIWLSYLLLCLDSTAIAYDSPISIG